MCNHVIRTAELAVFLGYICFWFSMVAHLYLRKLLIIWQISRCAGEWRQKVEK
jgi:hypothetical protein